MDFEILCKLRTSDETNQQETFGANTSSNVGRNIQWTSEISITVMIGLENEWPLCRICYGKKFVESTSIEPCNETVSQVHQQCSEKWLNHISDWEKNMCP